MNKFLPVAIVICLILVGGAFYGGVKYGSRREPNFAGKNMMNWEKNGASNFNNGPMKGGKAVGSGIVNGEVIAKDDKSVTVKIKDGGSKIVIFAASTAVTKTAAGTMDDVAVGANVMITGKTNADGSVTAETIQIRPDIAPSTQK